MASSNLKSELKGLGIDIAKAFNDAKDSPEFKKLKSDILAGVKSVSSSLIKAVNTAQKSQQTKKLKTRITRVVKLSKKEGLVQAKKAEAAVAAQIRKTRGKLNKLRRGR